MSSTLDDLEGHWQPVRWAILATAGLVVIYLPIAGLLFFYCSGWWHCSIKLHETDFTADICATLSTTDLDLPLW